MIFHNAKKSNEIHFLCARSGALVEHSHTFHFYVTDGCFCVETPRLRNCHRDCLDSSLEYHLALYRKHLLTTPDIELQSVYSSFNANLCLRGHVQVLNHHTCFL